MITVQLTPEEILSLIQSLESERAHYLKEYGSNPLSLIQESAQRAIDRINKLMHKLQFSMQQQNTAHS